MAERELEGLRALINSRLLAYLQGEPGELYEAARHIMAGGGKRLRPILALCLYRHLGGRGDILPAALCLEYLHNFTLIHDDIMDRDEVRHNLPTTHVKYGLPLAILAGDLLFAKAFELLGQLRGSVEGEALLEGASLLAQAMVRLCEGQALDMRLGASTRPPSVEQYLKLIELKTATLYQASAALGALLAGAQGSRLAEARAFGANLGMAFQITDDILGLFGEERELGKPVGNDLREGKKTLPLLLALERDEELARIIRRAWARRLSGQELERALRLLRERGIEREARALAEQYAGRAKESLARLGPGPYAELLGALADFVVKRRF
ncbi:MAG: geranylgeranyl pyrophosphate synthase [Nitrososphaerota archaeon]